MGEARRNLDEKREAFEREPEKFVHVDDLSMAIFRDEDVKKRRIIVGGGQSVFDLQSGVTMLKYHIGKICERIEFEYFKKQQEENRIVAPDSGGNGQPRFKV